MKKIILLISVLVILALTFICVHPVFARQLADQPLVLQTTPKTQVKPVLTPLPPPPNCEPGKVRVPSAAQDSKPVITINALASRGSGQIQYPEASQAICASPCQSTVTLNTELLLTINANNPGGVKNIGVTIAPPDGPSFGVEREASPDTNNCVYPTLSILGHNGAGHIGSIPLLFHMNKATAKVTFLVRSTNFNNQSSLYAVTYFVKTITQPVPKPLPAANGCLSLHYGFTWGSYPAQLSGQDLPITIHFHGEFKGTPLPKSTTQMTFDLTKTYKVLYPYSATWTGVSETFSNLMPGLWTITAQYMSGLGGLKHYDTPIICSGKVVAGTVCGVVKFNHDEQTCGNR